MKRQRIVFVLAASLVACLLIPGAAGARVIHFTGHAAADPGTDVTFDMKGFVKKFKKNGKTRKRFVAKEVSNVHVVNQLFTCYDAAGNPVSGGRFTLQYPFHSIPPMKVVKPQNPRHGPRFEGKYRYPESGDPITLNLFGGYFPKGNPRRVSGHFMAQYGVGGISYGFCGNEEPEFWTGRFKL